MANARNRLRPYAVHRASVRFGRRATHRAIGVCATLVTGLVVGLAAPAGAIPPPPENPTDDQIAASQDQAAQINTAVGNLSAEVASTQGRIDALRNDMQYKQELSQKAAIDLDIAVADAAAADTAATAAADAATAAEGDIATAQSKADSFAAASFRQGSTLGSVSALWDATSADQLLQRTQLLESISGSQLDVIGNLQRAQVSKSNLDAAARQALQVAKDASAAADLAKQTADKAAADAADALQVGQGQLEQLQTDLSNQQIAYQAAVNTVNTLQGQREAYNEWLVLKAAEEERLRKEAEEAARKAAEEEAARQAAAAAAAAAEAARVAAEQESQRQAAAAAAAAAAESQRQAARSARAAAAAQSSAAAKPAASKPTTTTTTTPTPAFSGSIGSQVVAAAKQWLGTKYVWAGGNANGPTGGGFDCSGLMLYAYAQVGINMPHYSGYQYYEGARVAKADLQPGDLVFYAYDTSDPTTIHHVAMYIGDGQMIEAPYTGSWVRIMPLRTSDYIGAARPYA